MNKFEKISEAQFFKDFAEYIDNEALDTRDALSIYNSIKLPCRATISSAGYDIYAPYNFEILPKQVVKIPTGIRVILEPDKFLAIYPRSGLGFKYRTQLANTVGIIDSDYYYSDNEGHIWVKLYNGTIKSEILKLRQGEAICQGIIQQFFKTVDDKVTNVRNGGFGSTTQK